MSKKTTPVYYWDASVFSAYVNKEGGRWQTVDALLEECNKGNIEIWTSTLSITEVAQGKDGIGKVLPVETEERIDALWKPPSKIKLIELSLQTCKQARSVIRHIHANNKTGIRSADAIHIASAIQKKINEIHTYDDITKFATILKMVIKAPELYQNVMAFQDDKT